MNLNYNFFSKSCFLVLLFVDGLFSSENKPEGWSKKDVSAVLKKAVIPLGVGIAVSIISNKFVFIVESKGGKLPYDFDGFIKSICYSLGLKNANVMEKALLLTLVNLKGVPYMALLKGKISLDNGHKLCGAISALHGLCAGAICHYGLKKYFPNEKNVL